jgi:hypothetical protein
VSSVAELITRLQAAVNPPAEGDAVPAEQREAVSVLARLQAADAAFGAVPTPSTTDDFNARHASWEAARASTLADLDRAARAVMRIIREAAPRYSETSPDARGNVISPELLGEPIDPAIRAMDPGSPLPAIAEGTTAHLCVSCIARHAINLRSPFDPDSGVDDATIQAALDVADAYDAAHARTEPVRAPASQSSARSDTAAELTAARKAAQDLCDYLDAELVT